MLNDLSDECARLAKAASRSLVHIGGPGIKGRTGILRGPGLVASLAREASEGESVELTGPEGERRRARVRAYDAASGLVLLEPDRPWEGAGEWVLAPPPGLGSLLLVVAFPSPAGTEAVLGNLRFVGSSTSWGGREAGAFFQLGSPAFPGFAGAAVLDAAGRLVGVVTANEAGNEGWVLGAEGWSSRVDELLREGSRRPFRLGLGLMPARLGAAQAKAAGRPEAALVTFVKPGSPAESAGILVGDLLLGLDGSAIPPEAAGLASMLTGKEVALDCLRGEARVQLRARPAPAEG